MSRKIFPVLFSRYFEFTAVVFNEYRCSNEQERVLFDLSIGHLMRSSGLVHIIFVTKDDCYIPLSKTNVVFIDFSHVVYFRPIPDDSNYSHQNFRQGTSVTDQIPEFGNYWHQCCDGCPLARVVLIIHVRRYRQRFQGIFFLLRILVITESIIWFFLLYKI